MSYGLFMYIVLYIKVLINGRAISDSGSAGP